MVSSLGYGDPRDYTETSSDGTMISIQKLHGEVIFQPPFCSHKQFARWAEITGFRRNPFLTSGMHRDNEYQLHEYYGKLGIDLDGLPYSSALILMAAPFANEIVTVVAPSGLALDPIVSDFIQRRRLHLKHIPLEIFDEKDVQRIATCHLVSVIAQEPRLVFSHEAEKIIGEHQEQYMELVPNHWLNFG